MKGTLRFSVIIPVYNEERRIGHTILKIMKYMNQHNYEYDIIIVDDGSTDHTIDVIKNFKNNKISLLRNKKNIGKGYSIKKGVLFAQKDYLLIIDADLSTPIEELENFINYTKHYDIIIGSRRMEGSKKPIRQPFYRIIAGGTFSYLVNLFLLRDIKDTQCGFKLFKKNIAKRLFSMQTINRFSFDAEIMYLAKKFNYKVKELPVLWANDLDSRLDFIRDSVIMLIDLLRIKVNDIKGIYS